MTTVFMKYVKDEIRANESIIKKLRSANKPVEPGHLETYSKGKKKTTVYRLAHMEGGKRKRNHLGTANSEKFKEYLIGLCVMIRIEILQYNNKILRRLLEVLLPDTIEVVNARLPRQCRGMLKEGFVDERMEELKAWAAEDYPRNSCNFRNRTCIACDGTHVRSKGEIIIYNMLVALGIPFRYDCLISVTDDWERKIERSPDFLIQCYDGTFIIIEHLGGLLNADYCNGFAAKCRFFLREGYVLGENFFVTSDDGKGGVNAEAIAEIIQIVERRFYKAA